MIGGDFTWPAGKGKGVETKAYAKINLTLEILGRRPDGYHEVSTILQTIDLADRIYFAEAPRLEVRSSLPELDGPDNLVWKAADALRRAAVSDQGAKIRVEKHIPVGMGLGGGSSDAAATLSALNTLWKLGKSDGELRSLAQSLGSDVPFFIEGGTALGTGRGEVIVALPPLPEQWVVLLCPAPLDTGGDAHLGRKTARLYSMVTGEHYTDGSHTRRVADSLKGGSFHRELLFNVFEPLAPSAFPEFDRARGDFLGAGAESAHLSGTGPALYALVSRKDEAEEILKSLKRMGHTGYGVVTVHPACSGALS